MQPSEKAAVVAAVSPVNGNNTTTLSDAVDMSKFGAAMFVLMTGVIDQTVNFKLQESDASGGSYADITGKAITQLADTADGKQAVINLKADEITAGKRFVKAAVTVGNGTSSLVAVVGLGMNPRFGPASDDDLASVVQIVT